MSEPVFQVVGIRKAKYTDKKTGEVKPYGRVYCQFDEDGDTEGVAVVAWKIKPEKIDRAAVTVGDIVNPFYNKYGDVDDISIVQ